MSLPPVFTFTKTEKSSPTLYAPLVGDKKSVACAAATKGHTLNNTKNKLTQKNTNLRILVLYHSFAEPLMATCGKPESEPN